MHFTSHQLRQATRDHQKKVGIKRCLSRTMSWYQETDEIEMDEENMAIEYKTQLEDLRVDEAELLVNKYLKLILI